MQEKENVTRILEESKKALNQNDSQKLLELSNQTINTASLTQDPDNIAIAVITYSLSKIVQRTDYRELPGWNGFFKKWNSYLDETLISIKKNDEEGTRKNLENIRKEIGKLSGKLRTYIQEVFRKASVNKASRIYEHGISMEKTAKLLGISMWELASYAGQTGIPDAPFSQTLTAKARIKLATEFFK